MEVLLLALAAHRRLQEATAVLRGCRELADLSVNAAVTRAEFCVRRLSSLVVSLEFPPYDAGCSSEQYNSTRGAAAAMPVAQVSGWQKGRGTEGKRISADKRRQVEGKENEEISREVKRSGGQKE
jgi:hypothetical protein